MDITDDHKKALEALTTRIKEIITLHRPLDITTEKILQRAAVMTQNLGITRTSVLGAVAYTALHAAVVGLTKDQVTAIVVGALEEAEKVPAIKEIAAEYKKTNDAILAKQGQGGAPMPLAPKSDIVH